ncbi:1-deoxy-D-xylulose 5-phosphate reductoisomerase [Frankliniella fusca]|uniref:1-deoxy-D-xylulose 5-phosphate reductoisomerase n=1 Tax=Frankliniella fusca TaxID=407009 RepID=A0AAE1HPS5_9NEOP|nr:1-deoxy-D-xylulose 5-phosphate reductoisomerase [Frankliniella fusca]
MWNINSRKINWSHFHQAAPVSEGSTEMMEMLRKWVYAMLDGDITSSGPLTNDQPERSSGPIINVTLEDLNTGTVLLLA